jgi:hypothetical protein
MADIHHYVSGGLTDLLTFISNIWNTTGSFAWPAVFVIGLVLFRKPIERAILSLKFLRYKGLEVEMVTPQETSDQELNIIIYYLQRSPHSFQWFRDNTEIQYTNEQFGTLLAKHPKILEPVTIVSSEEEKRKSTPGLPGMRLTREYRQNIEKVLQSP